MASRTKFNVSKDKSRRVFNNIEFDSELELKFFKDVVLPGLENHTILDAQRQVKYTLQPAYKRTNGKTVRAIEYKADFVLTYENGVHIVDVKGLATQEACLKKRIFHYVYPDANYYWVGYAKRYGGFLDYDDLKKLRATEKKNKKKELQGESNNGKKD